MFKKSFNSLCLPFMSQVPWDMGTVSLTKKTDSLRMQQAIDHTITREPIIGKQWANHVIHMTAREVNKGWNFPESCRVWGSGTYVKVNEELPPMGRAIWGAELGGHPERMRSPWRLKGRIEGGALPCFEVGGLVCLCDTYNSASCEQLISAAISWCFSLRPST